MSDHHEISVFTRTFRGDPTRTAVLRNAFAKDMRRRFAELIKVVYIGVIERDAFGLNRPTVLQMEPPQYGQFAFTRSQQKLDAFMQWLEQQVRSGMLSMREFEQIGVAVEAAWTNKYIFDSYKWGVIRARMELRNAGYDVPTIDETGGIEISMAHPVHIDRLGLLYLRTYNELKGITDTMDQQISRILAQGIADGDGPRLLARKIRAVVDGTASGELGITDSLGRYIPAKRRAEMLARTEVIRAHHVATIQEYRNWGAIGVTVQAEWLTAGDNRVCPKCEANEGKIYSLDEIEGMIPAHPLCRCLALPVSKYSEPLKRGGQ